MTTDLYASALAAIEARRELVKGRTRDHFEIEMPSIADCEYLAASWLAFAADTDALAAVLERHAPWCCCVDDEYRCKSIGCSDSWPCPDAQSALTALGVTS